MMLAVPGSPAKARYQQIAHLNELLAEAFLDATRALRAARASSHDGRSD
jgi:hypothetical protein